MAILTFTSYDAFGKSVASADMVVDQTFNVNAGQHLVWHIDARQDKDLFDFKTGVKGKITWFPKLASPNGWGSLGMDNTLMMRFGNWQDCALFANLYNVLQLDPEDPDSGDLVSGTSGWGWLFRGGRLPSGSIVWTVT